MLTVAYRFYGDPITCLRPARVELSGSASVRLDRLSACCALALIADARRQPRPVPCSERVRSQLLFV